MDDSMIDPVWSSIEAGLLESAGGDMHAGLAWITDDAKQRIARAAIAAVRRDWQQTIDAAMGEK